MKRCRRLSVQCAAFVAWPFMMRASIKAVEPTVLPVQIGMPGETASLFIKEDAPGELDDLNVQWRGSRKGPWQIVHVAVSHERENQARVEVGCRLRVEDANTFFDGERIYECQTQRVSDRFTGRFPLTSVAAEGTCYALGYAPDLWLSYMRHAFFPGKESASLETATRIVVDPGKTERLRFVVGGFATDWGHEEALHWYYETFPTFFVGRADVDPRVHLNGGSYLAWYPPPKPELCRRMKVGWEWCYAPFKRTGDILGRQEYWDYTPAREHDDRRQLPLAAYQDSRRKRFANGQLCDVAMMCYIPSQIWCEEQLARDQYSDSLITDSRVKTYFDTPWVTGPDNELRVFPYKTRFGEQSLRDMTDLVAENNIQGFAFDTANGGGKYLGPHVNACPGRAWDDRGVFVDEGVAIAKLMDWCHAHQDDSGQTLAVVSNPGSSPCYLTPFRSDSAMIEADPTSVHKGSALTLRRFLGHKTMVFWENYEREELFDYENMPEEEMADALRGLADYTLIASLRIAAVPTPRVCLGLRKLVRWLPLLVEIAQSGWQPVPAARCDQGLPISRAGSGAHQFLMTGNETSERVSGRIIADHAWFAKGALLFLPEGHDYAENVVNAESTGIDFELASRDALVLRSLLALDPPPQSLKVRMERREDLHEMELKLSFRSTGPESCRLFVLDWGKMALVGASLDGAVVTMETCEGGWRSVNPMKLNEKQTLTLEMRSCAFQLSEETLFSFPWIQGEQTGFHVEVDRSAPEEVRYAAERLAGYFQFMDLEPAPIVPSSSHRTGSHVRVLLEPDLTSSCSIRLQSKTNTLLVSGRTPGDLKDGVYQLLEALDTRYPYAGETAATAAIRATGLQGKEID